VTQKPPRPERLGTIAEALEQAALALQARRLDEAERLAGGVLKANPADAAAAQLLGQALLLQGRAADAIAPLRRAARRGQDPVLETLLARALSDTDRADQAIDQLRQATTRRPAYPLAFVELGDLLGKLGRFHEALAALEDGLALCPDAHVLRVALGYLHLARNARARARALFQAVREAAPERHDARVALANVLALDGDHAGAAELYRQALGLRPDDAATQISLGKCLLEMGEREAGEAALRTAARGAPQMAGPAIAALATAARGRLFLRPSDAARFLS
jgi:predicted Zn-dependent protease